MTSYASFSQDSKKHSWLINDQKLSLQTLAIVTKEVKMTRSDCLTQRSLSEKCKDSNHRTNLRKSLPLESFFATESFHTRVTDILKTPWLSNWGPKHKITSKLLIKSLPLTSIIAHLVPSAIHTLMIPSRLQELLEGSEVQSKVSRSHHRRFKQFWDEV